MGRGQHTEQTSLLALGLRSLATAAIASDLIPGGQTCRGLLTSGAEVLAVGVVDFLACRLGGDCRGRYKHGSWRPQGES